MSKYTTELRYICETLAGYDESKGYNDVEFILNESAPKIFDFTFPIFDENHRLELEKKILKHYYTREICEETFGLWKLRLDSRMNEIMPYYNKLYESETFEFNPLLDFYWEKEHSGENSGESTGRNLFSDTPQGSLTNVDNGTYLTNATKITNEIEAQNYFKETIKGKTGMRSYSELLMLYRKSILNIDIMIIDNLSDLFIGLW